ncbi:transcriptional regulator [Bacillus thuringiensis]|nr:transcriptional regulator [Bacillus thuringiensis]
MKRFDGKKLYLLRKNRGFSQRELGELLNCSHSLVNLMENGKLQPTTAKLLGISSIFKVSIDELFIDFFLTVKLTQVTIRAKSRNY